MQISPKDALLNLAKVEDPFLTLFRHGTLEVEIYRPVDIDHQTPHHRDEIYIIISGSGLFHLEEEAMTFAPGDFLFVPAGAEHRFVEFSDDFSTWVLFYGPEGGETPT